MAGQLLGRVAAKLALDRLPPLVGHLLLAFWCLAVWIDPQFGGDGSMATLSALIIAEFIYIVFLAFLMAMGGMGLDVRWLWLFAPVAVWAGWSIGSPWPLVAFALHVFTEVRSVGRRPFPWHEKGNRRDEQRFADYILRWALLIVLLLASPLVVSVLDFPELGWTSGVVPSRYVWETDSGERLYHFTAAVTTTYFFGRAGLATLWRSHTWRKMTGAMADGAQ